MEMHYVTDIPERTCACKATHNHGTFVFAAEADYLFSDLDEGRRSAGDRLISWNISNGNLL
jgi:hypothetical protein